MTFSADSLSPAVQAKRHPATARELDVLEELHKWLTGLGYCPTVRELGKRLNMPPTNTSRFLKALIAKGFVGREKAAFSRRVGGRVLEKANARDLFITKLGQEELLSRGKIQLHLNMSEASPSKIKPEGLETNF